MLQTLVMADEHPLPLEGVRVLEVGANIAGPYGAMVLGDLGADVLKIEPPGGDDARRMAPVTDDSSAYFSAINRNKRSVVLDLATVDGRRELDRLLADADVLVTNLRFDSLKGLRLDCDSVLNAHPHLVYADISAYGSRGADALRSGYDSVLQARSGVMGVTGEEHRPPVRVGVSILDMGSGLWLALGVLGALRLRERTGRGARVSTSLLEVGAAFLAYHLAALQITGSAPPRQGTGHPAIEPYGVFATGEGDLSIGVGGDKVFERFARVLGAEWLTTDERFSTNPARVANRLELRQVLEGLLATRSAKEWDGLLGREGIPASRVCSVDDVLADEQLEALDAWVDQPVSEGSEHTLRLPGTPVAFDQRRLQPRLPPPRLGSDGAGA